VCVLSYNDVTRTFTPKVVMFVGVNRNVAEPVSTCTYVRPVTVMTAGVEDGFLTPMKVAYVLTAPDPEALDNVRDMVGPLVLTLLLLEALSPQASRSTK